MMNPLNNNSENPSWIGDGSEGSTLTVDGSSVSLASGKRGTPFNVRLNNDNLQPGTSVYFEVETTNLVNGGNMAVGLVTQNEFQPGWKTRGLFYNGNLTNGSAGLLIGFGDRIQTGDRVGVYVIRDGQRDNIQVVFYLNGRCLGVGFDVANVPKDAIFYPCLHLDGQAKVQYSAPAAFPAQTSREPMRYGDPYSGDWLLKQAFVGPELKEYPLPKDTKIVLSFHKTSNEDYGLSIKVANNLGTNVKLTGEKMEAFDTVQVGPIMSTMMMPPEALYEVERYLAENLPKVFKMIVNTNNDEKKHLIMTGETSELISDRYEKVFEPVHNYQ